MIFVESRDGKKELGLGLGVEMEETELEEGEALCYHDKNEDSAIDPDIALSYIEEKLQNVLGHFQKDFEGGFSAENLGAKFGGYGSFLPTYQRSPSWPHTRSPPEVHNYDTARSPRKLHLQDRRQNSLASSNASPSARPHDSTGKTVLMGTSLKGDVCLPSTHAKESILKCGVVKKSVNPSYQRTLKVRIKVGSENLSTQKNAEIYSGLGLVVSPSSSLDESPATSEGLCGNLLDMLQESPTSILQIMASSPVGLLLSPLPEDLIHLTEKRKLRGKGEFKPVDKTRMESSGILMNGSLSSRSDQKVLEQNKMKSSEKGDAFSTELTNQKNNGDQDDNGSLLKKDKETDIDTLGCEELVSNALKLPLLSSSQYSIADPAKSMSTATIVPLNALKDGVKGETFSAATEKEQLDSESAQDIGRVEKLGGKLGSSGKVSESKKENLASSIAAGPQQNILKAEKSHASDQSESNFSKGRKTLSAEPTDRAKKLVIQKGGLDSNEGLKLALEKSSTKGKRKQKGAQNIGAQSSYMPKNQLMVGSSMTSKSGKNVYANSPVSNSGSHGLQKDHEKPDRCKNFFGDVEYEVDEDESISGEMTSSGRLKDPQLLGKRSLSECHEVSKEKCNGKNSEKPHPLEKNPKVASHVAPCLENGSSSKAPTGLVPLVNEDWVSCDKCKKWRLLPRGTNPKNLPDKWVCRMLNWLPGLNSCSVPDEETTNALRALYHPAASVPAPASESQHNRLNNSVVTSLGVPSVDAGHPGEEHQNIAVQTVTISGKEKHGSAHAAKSTDFYGSTLSNSWKKNPPTSGKNSHLHRANHSPSVDACGYPLMRQSSSAVEKHNDHKKDDEVSLINFSDKGTNLNIRNKSESELVGSRASKIIKSDELHFDDGNWTSDNGGAPLRAGRSSTNGLSTNESRNDRCKYTNHKDSSADAEKNIVSGVNTDLHVLGTSDDGLLPSSKSDDKDSVRKRKGMENHGSHAEPLSSSGQHHQDSGGFMEEMCESDHWKKKKARVSNSGGKDTSGKASLGTKSRITKDLQNGLCMNNTVVADYLRSDIGSAQPSLAANSTSSKVSGSHKNKTSAQEVEGSPVESVSSSPLRFSNADKAISTGRNLVGKGNFHYSNSLTAVSQRSFSGGEEYGGNDPTGMVKKDAILTVNDHGTDVYYDCLCQRNQYACEKHSSEQHQVEEKGNTDQSQNSGSHLNKTGKGLSSNSEEKASTSGSNLDETKIKVSDSSRDSVDHMHLHEEKPKSRRNKFQKKSGTPNKAEKFIYKKDTAGGTPSKGSKGQKIKFEGHDDQYIIKNQDKKYNLQQEHEDEKLPMKTDQAEVCGNGKSHSLPPLSRVQTETVASLHPISGSQKENVANLAVDAFDNGDALKKPLNQRKEDENQNGLPIGLRHPTPNSHKVRDAEAPSPGRRDSSSHAANNALKEAKDLKHLADRLKNSGSTESMGFYFQAALKFLHGASLLESGTSEGTKHNDMMHSIHIYSSTAKLCEFCAHEYEKSKDMAAAALAYKCMEVAYMRVVYSSHTSASRDRNELQTVLQIVPPGESPLSSASDVDNLNHQATTDKATLAKVVGSPQLSGSHIITSRRVIKFAQDVNFAMEASRKSRIAFTAATSILGETTHKEGICSLKKALDFNFQDVEGLLRLVRVAMEAISR
ncbi:hypothetical protein Pfo_017491 [Paulownia fortunei]|nr:hypothetical protein Pfo_017491 [Paulownia fortunei]